MKAEPILSFLPLAAFLPMATPTGLSAQDKGADHRLNIIHIMTDDHSFQTISAYGHPISALAPTPNIDRLAAQGIVFNRAYVENSLSTPSRACLMTGLYSHQNGQTMLDNVMDSTVTFVPELLHAAGYQTAVIGKWHMQCDPKGFDTYMVLRGQGPYYRPGFKTPETNGKYVAEEGYTTEQITKHALEFLENRDTDKPFCLYVHHKAPHRSWDPAIKYLELYEDITFPLPETFYDDYSTRGAAMQEQRMRIDENMNMDRDLKVVGWPGNRPRAELPPAGMPEDQQAIWYESYNRRNKELFDNYENMTHEEFVEWKYQRYLKDYLRVIRSVDDSVGEILDYLEENGLMENTVIVYTSDQGFYMGEHGWFDKRFMFEESYRTPLIVRYPGNAGNTKSEAYVQNIDFGPTYLDIAGVKQLKDMHGKSIVPILKKDGKEPVFWRKYMYYHFYDHTDEHNVMRHDGISTKRYKLIHFYDETGAIPSYEEFYDLQADPKELVNAIDKPQYKRIVRKFYRKLDKMRARLGVEEY